MARKIDAVSEDEPPLTAEASIAQVTGALKTMGDGGFRWIFEAPETELPAHVRLHLYRGKRLKLTFELMEPEETQPEEQPKAGFGKWQKD